MSRGYSPEMMPRSLIRRDEYACDDAWVRDFMARVEVGYVATRWDDQPFITPVNFWYDPERHEIYFHTNGIGRLRANSQRHTQVCFAASEFGRALPSNVALEFTMQYASVVAFGRIRLLQDKAEAQRALYGLIRRYFPHMQPGEHYRPITPAELKRTAAYAIAIDNWSGKRNWPERAEQSAEWPGL